MHQGGVLSIRNAKIERIFKKVACRQGAVAPMTEFWQSVEWGNHCPLSITHTHPSSKYNWHAKFEEKFNFYIYLGNALTLIHHTHQPSSEKKINFEVYLSNHCNCPIKHTPPLCTIWNLEHTHRHTHKKEL